MVVHRIVKKVGEIIKEKYDHGRYYKELVEADSLFDYRFKICRNGNIVYDLCTGHGILAASLATWSKNSLIIGMDIHKRKYWDEYYFISNLLMIQGDIFTFNFDTIPPDAITAIHACKKLSIRAIEIAAKYNVPIWLIPCCQDRKKVPYKFTTLMEIGGAKDPQYLGWCYYLAELMENYGYEVRIRSPKKLRKVTTKHIILMGR